MKMLTTNDVFGVESFCFKGQAWFNGKRVVYEQVNMANNHKEFLINEEGLFHSVKGKQWDKHSWYLFLESSIEGYTVYKLETEFEILMARIKYEKNNSTDWNHDYALSQAR